MSYVFLAALALVNVAQMTDATSATLVNARLKSQELTLDRLSYATYREKIQALVYVPLLGYVIAIIIALGTKGRLVSDTGPTTNVWVLLGGLGLLGFASLRFAARGPWDSWRHVTTPGMLWETVRAEAGGSTDWKCEVEARHRELSEKNDGSNLGWLAKRILNSVDVDLSLQDHEWRGVRLAQSRFRPTWLECIQNIAHDDVSRRWAILHSSLCLAAIAALFIMGSDIPVYWTVMLLVTSVTLNMATLAWRGFQISLADIWQSSYNDYCLRKIGQFSGIPR